MKQKINSLETQLAILRIGVAISIIVKICVEFNQIDLLFSRNGIIQDILTNGFHLSYTISLPTIINSFNIKNEHLFLTHLYLLNAVSALFLLVGLQSRISAFICLVIHMLFFNGYNLITFGFDGFIFTLLFYTFLFPVGKVFSLDNLIYKNDRSISKENLEFYIKVLQIHLCIVYVSAGIAKLKGFQWLDGTAIWYIINQPQFYTNITPFIKPLVSYPAISTLLSWGTLFVEVFFVVFIWVKKFKLNMAILLGIILMHVFIGLVMGLQLFAWIMIVFDLSAFAGIFLNRKGLVHQVANNEEQVAISYAVK